MTGAGGLPSEEITVCLVVSNRHGNLANALNSVNRLAVRIVVVDSGSGGKSVAHLASEYDLVVDPEHASMPEVCEIICATLARPEYQTTSETLEEIELMTLAADLRARIAMDPTIPDDGIEVVASDGVIRVGGAVHSKEDAEAIAELLDMEIQP